MQYYLNLLFFLGNLEIILLMENFLSTSNQTNLVGYYLPHFDQYEYNLDLVDAKKNRIELWIS